MISQTNFNKSYPLASAAGSPRSTTTEATTSVDLPQMTREDRSGVSVTISREGRIASTGNSATEGDAGGKKILQDRLFGGSNPEVVPGFEGMSSANISKSPYSFLTTEDRNLLSAVYAESKSAGVDLNYVDQLAGELGEYRKHDNGRLSTSFNNGMNYDMSGRRLTIAFSQEDSETAARILNGKAFSSTSFDKGFLKHILDPGYGALSNTSSLKFLERVVIQTSREDDQNAASVDDFSAYSPVKNISDSVRLSADSSATLPPFEPDLKNENGTWVVTEKGHAAGITLNQWKTHMYNSSSSSGPVICYVLNDMFSNDLGEKPEGWLSRLVKGFNI